VLKEEVWNSEAHEESRTARTRSSDDEGHLSSL